MKRLGLVLLVVAVFPAAFIVGGAGPAAACSCVGLTEREALASADAAFVGIVTDVERPARPTSSLAAVTASFVVESVFKGDVAADQQVVTALESASCGFNFESGIRYLVFAATSRGRDFVEPGPLPGQLSANLCGGTRTAERGEVVRGFPRPQPVSGSASDRSWVIPVGIASAVLLAGVGVVAVRRSKRSPKDPTF
jgi:hypothetical protein